MNKQDIENRSDIESLVSQFYNKVLEDPVIGPIFKNHMTTNLEEHLPIMYDFWESVLLDGTAYKGNPILSHIHLNQRISLDETHFNRWEALWLEKIDELFSGSIAEDAKAKASHMKKLIMYKILASKDKNFIQ